MIEELESYFEDMNLLKAFAKENSGKFLDFVDEYLREAETEARLNDEREDYETED
jgi:hypothetical protein